MDHAVSAPKGSTTERVQIKRAYEPARDDDGYRVLVDRLWPRGVSKEKAHLNAWMKDIAPSTELRQWFDHDPARWDAFERRYRAELAEPERRCLIDALANRATHEQVTLIYGARDTAHNEAVVLCAALSAAHADAPDPHAAQTTDTRR